MPPKNAARKGTKASKATPAPVVGAARARSSTPAPPRGRPAAQRPGPRELAIRPLTARTPEVRQLLGGRQPRVRGRGDYDIGSALGGLAGGLFGMPELGSAAGKLVGSLFGRGDYHSLRHAVPSGLEEHPFKRRAAKYTAAKEQGVAMHDILRHQDTLSMSGRGAKFGAGDERPRVRHREFVGEVLGSTEFSTQLYRIQPGLRGLNVMFPWLSSVAKNFQQYEARGIILEYESTSSDYTATTTLGTVYLSTLYNVNALPLASEAAVANNDFTTEAKPSRNVAHPIECADADNPVSVRFVRASNSVEAGTDDRLDDIGIFQVSTIGCSDDANGKRVGTLWVTYDIEFLKPALQNISEGTSWQASFIGGAPSGSAWAAWWTSQPRMNPGNSLPVTIPGTAGEFLMPAGFAGKFIAVAHVTNAEVLTTPLLWSSSQTSGFHAFDALANGTLSTAAGVGTIGAAGESIAVYYFESDGTGTVADRTLSLTGPAPNGDISSLSVSIFSFDPDITTNAPVLSDAAVGAFLQQYYTKQATRPNSLRLGTNTKPVRPAAHAATPMRRASEASEDDWPRPNEADRYMPDAPPGTAAERSRMLDALASLSESKLMTAARAVVSSSSSSATRA